MKLKVSKSKRSGKAAKPRPDFPLTPHPNGWWCKKVRGKLHYFGKCADDPEGKAALDQWLAEKDDLLAGRTPRAAGDGLTVRDLVNHFLTVKQAHVDSREITQRHFDDLHAACELLVTAFGKNRLVTDLSADDFEKLRADLAKTRGAWALTGAVQKIRGVFKYGYEACLFDKPVRYGPNFKRPGKAMMRRERADRGERLFSAVELRKIIKSSGIPLTAMILLGINGGLGNSDCGQLQFKHLDLDNCWLNYPRPKTGVSRKIPLWPETLKSLKAAITDRPTPKNEADAGYVFVTKYGQPWAKDKMANPISAEFRKLLVALKMNRDGLSFYTLRHTFATIAGGSRDQVAVNSVMGHADASMAATYRERIEDDRLGAVANHVRQWLFGTTKPATKRQK
jgi:integrase